MIKKKNYPELISYFSKTDVRGIFSKIFEKKNNKKI